MKNELRGIYEGILASIEPLPSHSGEEIAATARHLSMMAYQCPVDFTMKDFIFLTKGDLEAELSRIANMSQEELRRTPSQVEEWPDMPTENDVERNRIRRMEFLLREFRDLARLRSNDPKAWDKINELYYDD